MNICILGNNLEAWTLAAGLSSTGFGVSIDQSCLPGENSEIAEPDLLLLLEARLSEGRITLAGSTDVNCKCCSILIDARSSLPLEEHFSALENFVRSAEHNESTHERIFFALVQSVAVGTTSKLQARVDRYLADNEINLDVDCIYWPSFIEAGRALQSFTKSERIIIGCSSGQAATFIQQLMSPFNRSKDVSLVMQPSEAELTKIAINGMLATRISYMNELADLATHQGVDIEPVRQGMGADSRIGHHYLYPGCGFGGDSFLRTLDYLQYELTESQIESDCNKKRGRRVSSGDVRGLGLLQSVRSINTNQKDLLFQKFWRYFKADLENKKVALWGAAFKPNTSSISGSPALTLLRALVSHHVHVNIFDPMAVNSLQTWLLSENDLSQEYIHFCHSPEEAAHHADAIMLVTEWQILWNLNLSKIAENMRIPLLLDGRNVYQPFLAEQAGFVYSGIGRGLAI